MQKSMGHEQIGWDGGRGHSVTRISSAWERAYCKVTHDGQAEAVNMLHCLLGVDPNL